VALKCVKADSRCCNSSNINFYILKLNFSYFVDLCALISLTAQDAFIGPKRDEVTGGWKKLHNEELRDLYSSPSIIRIIKSRRMRRAGHVARMWGKEK
jgi:hypothetical protein